MKQQHEERLKAIQRTAAQQKITLIGQMRKQEAEIEEMRLTEINAAKNLSTLQKKLEATNNAATSNGVQLEEKCEEHTKALQVMQDEMQAATLFRDGEIKALKETLDRNDEAHTKVFVEFVQFLLYLCTFWLSEMSYMTFGIEHYYQNMCSGH